MSTKDCETEMNATQARGVAAYAGGFASFTQAQSVVAFDEEASCDERSGWCWED